MGHNKNIVVGFLSAIYFESEGFLCDPEYTNCCEDLLRANRIKDNSMNDTKRRWARIGFVPDYSKDVMDLNTWKLTIDSNSVSDWIDEKKLRVRLYRQVNSMIINDKADLLLGGCHILGPKADIQEAKNVTIKIMLGSGKIGMLSGFSRVDVMRDSSEIEFMHDHTSVMLMYDSSKVEQMHINSQVGSMYDKSVIGKMRHSCQVDQMHNTSKVKEAYDNSRVEAIFSPSAGIVKMLGSSGYMH